MTPPRDLSQTWGPYRGTIIDWHDGDTCHVRLDLGFGIEMASGISCRIYGINAPELTDKPAGQQARAYALQIAPPGTPVLVLSHGWDKYGGRFDGTLTLPEGHDFAQEMLDSGNAVVLVER